MNWTDDKIEDSFNRICEHISEGNSLNSALELHDTPVKHTFYKWIDHELLNEPTPEQVIKCKERMHQYARAKEDRHTVIFEEILDIADNNSLDVSIDDEGKWQVSGEIVQRSRLRIDSRKWMLGKMNAKKYGDKIDVTSGNKPITTSVDVTIHPPVIDED